MRVIDENGNSIGVLNGIEAQKIANSRGLDLVEVSPNAKPPVCRICDFGKFIFEKHKREKLQKKHQSVMTVKEIRFNANTDKHDTEFKCKHLKQFLIDGHKVKATVIYKGRMITHPETGRKLMDEILSKLVEFGKLEAQPKMEGKFLIAYLLPDKQKINVYKEKQKHLVGPKPASEHKEHIEHKEDIEHIEHKEHEKHEVNTDNVEKNQDVKIKIDFDNTEKNN